MEERERWEHSSRVRSRSPTKRPRAYELRPKQPSTPKAAKPKRRALATRGAATWLLLAAISAAALYSQLRVAGVFAGAGDDGASERRSLLSGLQGMTRKEATQADYRRLHSHRVTLRPEELLCRGRLLPETVALLRPQLRAQREAAAEAAAGARPPPLFLAARDGRAKHCRNSPRSSKRPPRLHRVALLTPEDPGGLAWVDEAASGRRLQQEQQQLAGAGAGGEAAAQYGGSTVPHDAGITLITQLSLDRLGSLAEQCASWRGPTAAVVYAPLVRGRLAGLRGSPDKAAAQLEGGTPLDALEHVQQAYERIAALQGACSLTLELVVEERCNSHLAALWPINANRNRGLMLAATPAVLLADVDFVLGGSLSPSLKDPEAAAAGAALPAARTAAGAAATAQYRRRLEQQATAAGAAAVAATGGSSSSSSNDTVSIQWGVGRRRAAIQVDTSDAAIAAGLAAMTGAHATAGSKNRSRDDAWLAASVAAGRQQGMGWLEAVLSQNAAVVLPAFEPTGGARRRDLARGRAVALAAARGGKRLLAALAAGRRPWVIGFQQDRYPRGHRATRFWWWFQATQPYAVDYWQGFEPFLLMPTAATPLYDERFRGYGWDKHVHTLHAVRQLGMRLVVHPSAWLVHLPHPHSAAQSESHATGQRTRLHDLFVDARRAIWQDRFVPVSAYWPLCARPRHAGAAAKWETAAAREAERQRREAEAVADAAAADAAEEEEQQQEEEEDGEYEHTATSGADGDDTEEGAWADGGSEQQQQRQHEQEEEEEQQQQQQQMAEQQAAADGEDAGSGAQHAGASDASSSTEATEATGLDGGGYEWQQEQEQEGLDGGAADDDSEQQLRPGAGGNGGGEDGDATSAEEEPLAEA